MVYKSKPFFNSVKDVKGNTYFYIYEWESLCLIFFVCIESCLLFVYCDWWVRPSWNGVLWFLFSIVNHCFCLDVKHCCVFLGD